MGSRGNTWSVPAGQTEVFTVLVRDGAGQVITGQYSGAEPLLSVVWEGSDLAAVPGVLNSAWQDAANGAVLAIASPPADTRPGYYRVRLSVTYAGATSPFYYGWLRVEAIPGTAGEPPSYCTLEDLVDLAGDWVEKLMQSGAGDGTNFLRERAMARQWLDDIIVSRSRVFAYRFDLTYALYYGSFPFGPVESPDQVIANYLAADNLMVRPRTVECTSYKALAFICEKRQTFDENGEAYRQRATFYHRKASNSVRRYRAELDTNADSRADIAFNLGVLTFR